MGRKILLAEDSLTIRKVFELILASSDVALTVVDNGEDAVRMAGELAPDLVIADVTLPGRDGFEVAAALRLEGTGKPLPVLLLAGSLAPFDEEKFKKSGARGVLFKPFESQELLDKIEEVFREGTEAAAEAKASESRPADEPWDFSDVLEEVEATSGKGAPPPKTVREDIPGLSVSMASETPGAVSLGEFDVSLEEIGTPKPRGLEPAPPVHPTPVPPPHIEIEDALIDAPPAVTDITPAIEAVEEIEEIEDLEEMEPLKEVLPPPPVVEAPPVTAAPPAVEPPPPPPEFPDREFRDRFASRAEEIFERVAAEAVEKVLWEQMDRLSADFTARIRESVESVAWEVIPATAESLIREEIARIRSLSDKKVP